MDGDDLESEPSESDEPKTLAEIFADAFPYYLSMGMSYDEFWYGAPSLVRDYRKAWEIKRQNDEYARWRQGMYFYDALLRVSPVLRAFGSGKVEPMKYPDRPYPMTEAEAREQQEHTDRENYKKYIERMKADSKRRKQKRQEVNDDGEH